MHKEVLTAEQKKILPLLEKFSTKFYLAGGTAIALQIGHRQSIDFDLFSFQEFPNSKIRNLCSKNGYRISKVLRDDQDQFTILVNKVKITFLFYPFKIKSKINLEGIKTPDLLTLSAMKAYTLSRRTKWKDYVDLYFILRDFFSFEEVVKKSQGIFDREFNEKIFRESLAYFEDIDYSEKIIFLPKFKVSDQKIKSALVSWAIS